MKKKIQTSILIIILENIKQKKKYPSSHLLELS